MLKKYYLKMLKTTDNNTLLTGVNSLGLVSLLAYTIRTFNEVNSNLEELRSEIDVLRKSHSENNKRSNIAFNHLNAKLEENTRMMSSSLNTQRTKLQPRMATRQPQVYQEEELEEITTDHSSRDEITGALSDLLSN